MRPGPTICRGLVKKICFAPLWKSNDNDDKFGVEMRKLIINREEYQQNLDTSLGLIRLNLKNRQNTKRDDRQQLQKRILGLKTSRLLTVFHVDNDEHTLQYRN